MREFGGKVLAVSMARREEALQSTSCMQTVPDSHVTMHDHAGWRVGSCLLVGSEQSHQDKATGMSKVAAGTAPAIVIGFCLAELDRVCYNKAPPLHRAQHAQAALSASAHRATNRHAGSRLLEW